MFYDVLLLHLSEIRSRDLQNPRKGQGGDPVAPRSSFIFSVAESDNSKWRLLISTTDLI